MAAREVTGCRLHHRDVPVTQHVGVLLHRRLHPHRVVHRGSDDDRASRGQQRGGDDVVGPAAGDPPDHVGGGRRDQDELRPIAEEHVRLGRAVRTEEPGQYGVACDALKRRRPDEPRGRRSHGDTHVASGLGQRRREVDDLVGRDPTRDEESNAQAAQLVGDRGWV